MPPLKTVKSLRSEATASPVDLERLVGLEFVRATEVGALSAYKWMGKGDKESADFAACDAIRGLFDTVSISGVVTIGEGIKDDAPGIFKGERLGTWSPGSVKMAIALDPIDGTTIVSKGLPGAICVMAAATCENDDDDPNTLLADIPSFYMNKISFGPRVKQGPGRIRLDNTVQDNLEIIALKLGKRVQDLTIVILDRPRHERLIHDVRRAGAAIRLISDGDIAAAIAPSLPGSGVDVYMGTGGSPEAVLAAAGIKCLGGEILAQMWPRDNAERAALLASGTTEAELAKVYNCDDLARGNRILFAATGISDSALLRGIRYEDTAAITESILMRAKHQTVRYIKTVHNLDLKTLRLRSDASDHAL
ncbi:MAG TPA: class II fructose-bisphosphatase [Tepidisphaeraceae bacterium]|nr:class II fructose-bisphosphatase [Tepidisphaeraceae bacterium]